MRKHQRDAREVLRNVLVFDEAHNVFPKEKWEECCGDSVVRGLQWGRVDLLGAVVTVGSSKTEAGQGRTIPLNAELLEALKESCALVPGEIRRDASGVVRRPLRETTADAAGQGSH